MASSLRSIDILRWSPEKPVPHREEAMAVAGGDALGDLVFLELGMTKTATSNTQYRTATLGGAPQIGGTDRKCWALPSPPFSVRFVRQLPPSDRWVVFVGPHEHHSSISCPGARVSPRWSRIGLDRVTGRRTSLALERALNSPEFAGRPKLGSFSARSNVSGILTDTRSMARLLHRYGASPASTSAARRAVRGDQHEDTVYCEDPEEREDAGTPAIVQKVRAAAAFRLKDWVGHLAIRERERWMVQRAMQRMKQNPKVQDPGTWRLLVRDPMVTVLRGKARMDV
ncbi:hypothetical protein HPP92_022726 [Vanilla planifolia]|uniref:Uncharacterized protein n=1 Tax=Vanilla planifolia TaxID=51239 RepID=A0A835UC70_VANPL|nr:hypothetical protein HPP92_022726 [Vanilla planifolia]